MNRHARILSVLLCVAAVFSGPGAGAKTGIIGTKHDLSKTGPGPYKALTEDRICVFCHTPHNALPQTPLWNKNLNAQNYVLYSSSTMNAAPQQPTGPSRLCLSCHDGTLALGDVRQPSGGIPMSTAFIQPGRPSYFGVSLAKDHPVAFEYGQALPNPELSPLPPSETLLFYNNYVIHCTTCHDPHDNSNKKFLAVNNVNSGLCTMCHKMTGWVSASHNTSQAIWNGTDTNPWPRTGALTDFGWTTVQENGCENCHTPHSADGTVRLLNSRYEERNCYPCHNGHVAAKDIRSQIASKSSKHNVEAYTDLEPHDGVNKHDPKIEKQNAVVSSPHVECVDCHNPHASNADTAAAPVLSGKLANVSGVDKSYLGIPVAQYEYEVCFKCHADSSSLAPFILRTINTTNARDEFNTGNPSYHPVEGTNLTVNVPSISLPFQDSEAPPTLSASSYIYCTDCHSDESTAEGGTGSRGPHGSQYAPILRRQYKTAIGTPENYDNYKLCYRCHNHDSILNDDSFRKTGGVGGHSGHLRAPVTGKTIPCSVCHDAHGVKDNLVSGSHSHLINFDSSIVMKTGADAYPIYTDTGVHTGSCTLECHFSDMTVKVHDHVSYP